ncbi:MAG: hypothetical protein V1674_01070 [Candidatus Omnitrophota bacterium]
MPRLRPSTGSGLGLSAIEGLRSAFLGYPERAKIIYGGIAKW